MPMIAKRLLSLKLTLVTATALLAGLLVHVSFTKADVTPCPPSTTLPPTSIPPTLTGVSPTQDHACGVVDGGGGVVQTDPPADGKNPHWTSVNVPPGFPMTVTIDEEDERFTSTGDVSAAAAPTCVPSSPYTCLVSNIQTTSGTNRRHPMQFRFTFDQSTIPAGKNIHRIRMYHNGNRVPFCDADPGEKPTLEQNQRICHWKTIRLPNNDVRTIGLTIINGSWRHR